MLIARTAMTVTLVASLAPCALVAMNAPAGASGVKRLPARAARSLNAADTARLHLIRASGSLLFEEGSASGGLSGSMRAHLNIGPIFTGSFTIYARGGTIKGHGSATPQGSGRYESFGGSFSATGGTGRYAHVHGHGGLYGTFDRKTYALVVQTTGRLSY